MVNIVFFGTPSFAVPALEALLKSEHSVVVVVTQPDRQRGRGQRLSASPIKDVALNSQLPVLQPTNLNDVGFLDELTKLRPDLGVVVAYGQFLPNRLLQLPRLGTINIHASLLPKYRGAAPIQRALMAGETETGITIIKLIQKMDAGPMLQHQVIPVNHDDTTETVAPRLAKLGARLLVSCVTDFAQGTITQENQDESKATFAPRITKEDGLIQWTHSAEQIHNQIRSLHPWPHAYSHLNNTRYLILQSEVTNYFPPDHSTTTPGQIIEIQRDRIIVATGSAAALGILKIQLPGRAPLATRAFLAGHPINPKSVFQSQSA
jgi:methionyl-tRNA formyltransferase